MQREKGRTRDVEGGGWEARSNRRPCCQETGGTRDARLLGNPRNAMTNTV